jgi:glutamyl-Q tRNA(Asp) synthetase
MDWKLMAEASMNYVGRFAPSPTGPLHFGSLVACLASYLDARAVGGHWLLRMEDLDRARCDAGSARQIPETLSRLGFKWDGEVLFQSRREARYAEVLALLSARGVTYACACSRREIADSAVTGIDGPVYPGTCRDKRLPVAAHAIRVRVPAGPAGWVDRVQGALSQDLSRDIGDFVLRRRDRQFAYQLAVVADDADQGVTHVVRGADLLDSTPRQIFLQRLLGFRQPRYLHIPVVVNAAGQKLSKQTLAPALDDRAGCQVLNRALQFLGQATIPEGHSRTPSDMLLQAASEWHPAAIPRLRYCHIP